MVAAGQDECGYTGNTPVEDHELVPMVLKLRRWVTVECVRGRGIRRAAQEVVPF